MTDHNPHKIFVAAYGGILPNYVFTLLDDRCDFLPDRGEVGKQIKHKGLIANGSADQVSQLLGPTQYSYLILALRPLNLIFDVSLNSQ